MHIERFSLCAAIFLLAAPALPQSVDFNAPRMYQLGGGAYSLAVGDFNGDGKPDLVAATEQGTVMLLGNGDGTFQPASTVPNVTRRGILVVVGDFNGDGKLDLAIAENASCCDVGIYLGNGNGTFQAGTTYILSGPPIFLVVGDFNGDGKLDLAVAVPKDHNVSILLGNGDGTLQHAVSYAAGQEPCSIAVADFNGDGRPDLAVVNRKSNNVSILVGNGDGTFPASARLCHCTGSHCPVAAADFDGDRTPDLVMSGWANLLRTPPIKPCVTRSFAFGVSANDLPNWRNDAVSRHPRQHPALAESQLRDLRDWVDSHTTSFRKYAQRNHA